MFCQNLRNVIFIWNFLDILTQVFLFGTLPFIKYLDKPIICLKMKANIQSKWNFLNIFPCFFTFYLKVGIFSTYLQLYKKCVLYFKRQISKCPTQENIGNVTVLGDLRLQVLFEHKDKTKFQCFHMLAEGNMFLNPLLLSEEQSHTSNSFSNYYFGSLARIFNNNGKSGGRIGLNAK